MATKDKIWLNQSEFARVMSIARQSVNQAIKEGRITQKSINSEGLIHFERGKKDYVRNTVANNKNSRQEEEIVIPGQKSLIDIKKETAQVTLAQQKHKLAVQIGKFVNKNEVIMLLFNASRSIRDTFQKIPDKYIDDIISNADNREDARLVLAKAIENTLREMAENLHATVDKINDTKSEVE